MDATALTLRRWATFMARAGALSAAALTVHTAVNLRVIRQPQDEPIVIHERVSILLPARDEAHRITATLQSLLAQEGLPNLEILILDDGSTDGTGDVIRQVVGSDPRVTIIEGPDDLPPAGWLGKSWACHRLAQQATGSVLVFVDADVDFRPWAVASTIQEMRRGDLELISPYPRQIAVTAAERLVQPLVTWSWMTALPMRMTERGHYPSMAAAVGQFLVVDTRAYRISGGHRAAANMILEDVGVLRAVKRAGFRGAPADGSAISRCRMYDSWQEMYDGYTKSVWSIFTPAAASYGLVAVMTLTYVAPPIFALVGPGRQARIWGGVGYSAGVLSRYLVAKRTGERALPDALAQPVSIAVAASLLLASLQRHRAGTLTWRGRPLP